MRRAAETGVAGLSIEDSDAATATSRCSSSSSPSSGSARRARRSTRWAPGVVLTGRSEGFIAGRPDLDETIRRLRAYADAGADCLYAPGISTREQIDAVVKAVAPKPVNVLIWGGFLPLTELAGAGRPAPEHRWRARLDRLGRSDACRDRTSPTARSRASRARAKSADIVRSFGA